MVEKTLVEVPQSILPSQLFYQGSSNLCGYHAAVFGINSLINLVQQKSTQSTEGGEKYPASAPCNVSVLDTILDLTDQKGPFSEERSLPFNVYKKLLENPVVKVDPHPILVKDAIELEKALKRLVTDQPSSFPLRKYSRSESDTLMTLLNDLYPTNPFSLSFVESLFGNSDILDLENLDPIHPLKSLINQRKLSTVTIPNIEIAAYDIFESVKDLEDTLLQVFKSRDPKIILPVILEVCTEDTPASLFCSKLHAISLVKLTEAICVSPQNIPTSAPFIQAYFRNTGGSFLNGPFDLKTVLQGMYKYNLGFHQVLLNEKTTENKNLRFVHNKRFNGIFHYSALKDVEKLSQLTLESKINPNIPGRNGLLPLIESIHHDSEKVFKILVEYKELDINRKSSVGYAAIHRALLDEETTKYLKPILDHPRVNANEFVDTKVNECTPLMAAIELKNTKGALELIQSKKVDVNLCNKQGNCPLEYAISFGNKDVFEALLGRSDIQLNLESKVYRSKLFESTKKDLFYLDALVKNKKFDPNITYNGMPLFIFLVNSRLVDASKILLSRPQLNLEKDFEGTKGSEFAENWGNPEILELIRRRTATPSP